MKAVKSAYVLRASEVVLVDVVGPVVVVAVDLMGWCVRKELALLASQGPEIEEDHCRY